MKRFFFLSPILFLTLNLSAQSNPGCEHLTVQAVVFVGQGIVNVTIANNCTNCSAAGYCALFLISPENDTIAKSDPSFFTPDNGMSQTYTLQVQPLFMPPFEPYRVSMPCVCDTIAVFAISGISRYFRHETIKIIPNPFEDRALIRFNKELKSATVILYNTEGRVMKQINNFSGSELLFDRNTLPEGLYFLEAVESGRPKLREKLIIGPSN